MFLCVLVHVEVIWLVVAVCPFEAMQWLYFAFAVYIPT